MMKSIVTMMNIMKTIMRIMKKMTGKVTLIITTIMTTLVLMKKKTMPMKNTSMREKIMMEFFSCTKIILMTTMIIMKKLKTTV